MATADQIPDENSEAKSAGTAYPVELPGLEGVYPNASLGPSMGAIVQRAGLGDIEALRHIFDMRMNIADDNKNLPVVRALCAIEAITLGRLMASRGDTGDVRKFAGALCRGAMIYREVDHAWLGDQFAAETLCVLEQLAEAGDDVAAISSSYLIGVETPEIIERARALRRLMVKEDAA